MPTVIPINAVYRMPTGRLARVQHCVGATVTLAYIPDTSPAADPMPTGDSVTVTRGLLLGEGRLVSTGAKASPPFTLPVPPHVAPV